MNISDLQTDDAVAIEQADQALVVGFREQAPDAWPDLIEARSEVHKALESGKVCRIARDVRNGGISPEITEIESPLFSS